MAYSSWECKGCTNVCYRMIKGKTFEYCRPMLEQGGNRTEWQGTHIACLDYTTDPAMTDPAVKMHECMERRGT